MPHPLPALLAALLLAVSAVAEDSFTLAILPDVQQETSGDRLAMRLQWLVANQKALNIKAVLQVGDLQNWDTPDHDQYEHQSAAFAILDTAKLPYALCLGNHDTAAVKVGGSAAPGNVNANLRITTTFNTYYPAKRFPLLGGAFEPGRIDNSFQLFRAGDRDWLVLSIELWARSEAVAWARKVVEEHPRHNVIVLTHSHLNGASAIERSNGGYGNNSPQYVYDQVMKPFANVRLVFSGHVGSHGYRVDTSDTGAPIHQFLQCYHSKENPVRLVTIDTRAGTIATRIHVPMTGKDLEDGSARTISGVPWVEAAPAKAKAKAR